MKRFTNGERSAAAGENPPADLVVYSLGWAGDHACEGDEPASGMLHSRVVLNGEEIPCATGVEVHAEGGDWTFAKVGIHVRSVRFVTLDRDDFLKDDLPPA